MVCEALLISAGRSGTPKEVSTSRACISVTLSVPTSSESPVILFSRICDLVRGALACGIQHVFFFSARCSTVSVIGKY